MEMKKVELDEEYRDVHSSESDSDLLVALNFSNSNQQGTKLSMPNTVERVLQVVKKTMRFI
jgi:hypothetical protein